LRTGSSRNDEGDINGFGGTENFELRTVTDPPIGRDTVRVKVAAAAFNPIDYQMRRGSTESKLLKSPILGREMGGTLTEVGELVTGSKLATRCLDTLQSCLQRYVCRRGCGPGILNCLHTKKFGFRGRRRDPDGGSDSVSGRPSMPDKAGCESVCRGRSRRRWQYGNTFFDAERDQ